MKTRNCIALIIPTQEIGGMERAMSRLANHFCDLTDDKIVLIKLTKGKNSFELNNRIIVLEPDFEYKTMGFLKSRLKTISFLRRAIKSYRPKSILSFGDRYNSLSIMSTIGLTTPVFVSNRMNPRLSNGKVVDLLNLIFYRFATGIVAQTNTAKSIFLKRYGNKNIQVIPNPIVQIELPKYESRENIILNVGRFSPQKNQNLLIDYFIKINPENWKLVFLGDGKNFNRIKEYARLQPQGRKIIFEGAVKNVNDYFSKAKIFAFTSTSEGFPNSLGEAMAHGLGCISFDCSAGPADLIKHEKNGFLIENFNHMQYENYLKKMIDSEDLIRELGQSAHLEMKKYDSPIVAQSYLKFITGK